MSQAPTDRGGSQVEGPGAVLDDVRGKLLVGLGIWSVASLGLAAKLPRLVGQVWARRLRIFGGVYGGVGLAATGTAVYGMRQRYDRCRELQVHIADLERRGALPIDDGDEWRTTTGWIRWFAGDLRRPLCPCPVP